LLWNRDLVQGDFKGEQVELAKKLCAFNKDLFKLHHFNPDPSLCSVPLIKSRKHLESRLGEELDPEMYQKLQIWNISFIFTYGKVPWHLTFGPVLFSESKSLLQSHGS
jgi:hypothetical protein